MQLIRYEAARSALAECHRVDEVKDIRDKAEAMAAYARQAKDSALIQYATEIKVRAERRCGELLRTQIATPSERGEMGAQARWDGKSKGATSHLTTLADMGLSKDESSRYQQLADMPAEHFETAVATAKATAGEVTSAFMLREAAKHKDRPKQGKKANQQREQLKAVQSRGVSMLLTYARLTLTAVRSQSEFTDEEVSLLSELALAIQQVGTTEVNR